MRYRKSRKGRPRRGHVRRRRGRRSGRLTGIRGGYRI